jgi:hypothetical protein
MLRFVSRKLFTSVTGLQIDISATEGVLRITDPLSFQNKHDCAIECVQGDATAFSPMDISEEYETLAKAGLDVSACTGYGLSLRCLR